METRLNEKFTEKFDALQKQLSYHSDKLSKHEITSNEKLNAIRGECLWRIKDAEELLKSRVSLPTVESMLSGIKETIADLMRSSSTLHEEKIRAEFHHLSELIHANELLSVQRNNDCKVMVAQ